MAVGFSIGTKGYIGTGESYGSLSLSDFWEWDQGTNTWTQKANCISGGIDDATGFSIGSKGYIGTGHNNASGYSFSYFYAWEQTTNTWTSVLSTGFGTQEGSCVSFSIGTKGYVATGRNDALDDLKEFYEYTGYVGIDDISFENNFSVYPNPVSDKLAIAIEGNTKAMDFEISNSIGQTVYKGNVLDKTVVQTSGFATGVYFIKLENDKSVVCRKFIKE
jgi:hypothetical protein